jgi:hypothetical protein
MKADTRTLQGVLVGDRRFIVPIFQRPYVWEKERQWEPLWTDIEATASRLAEARVAGFQKGYEVAQADLTASPHFLGAIVLEQSATATGALETRVIVDGQQRLTTLQLLLRGVLDSFEEVQVDRVFQARIAKTIRNDETVGFEAGEILKVTPRLAETEAFAEAMEAEAVDPNSSLFAAARTYFAEMARAFLVDDNIPPDPYRAEWTPQQSRASLLTAALLGLVKLVVIDLEQIDDAQIIFEALNARNTPLSATDLVKNLLFLKAQAEHFDPETLYNQLWKRFDDDADWWLKSTGVGHAQRANQDWLLGDWLTVELGRSVNVGRLYSEFSGWLQGSGVKAFDALSTLSTYADAYEALNGQRPGLSPVEHNAYSRIHRLNFDVVAPVLLWLYLQPPDILSRSERELAFRAVESFIIRRMAAKWQTRAYGRAFVEVLVAAQHASDHPGQAVIEALKSEPYQYAWPSDDDVVQQFISSRYYGPGGISQPRIRLILGAIDDLLQSKTSKSEPIVVDYESLQVEHVIPQGWRSTWPIEVVDPSERIVAELEREQHVNRIGNLTLIAGPLNASISNNPWGEKKAELAKFARIELNHQLVGESEWNEAKIAQRGVALANLLSEVWPGPDDPIWDA